MARLITNIIIGLCSCALFLIAAYVLRNGLFLPGMEHDGALVMNAVAFIGLFGMICATLDSLS